MYSSAVFAVFATYVLLYSSVRANFVPYIQTNTALDGELLKVSDVGTFDGLSALSCAGKCSSESTASCRSFLYNTQTGRCNIYDAVHADGPEGTTVDPWDYYTVRSSPSADINTNDCEALYRDGNTNDGVYTFTIEGGVSVTTWCDLTNGGWTVFRRQQGGSEDFNRNWTDYVQGFGDPAGEFWLGLDIIHLLTTTPSQLYIELEAFNDVKPATAYAQYTTFDVGDSAANYLLNISGFSGDCGDSITSENGRRFTTIDVDNDADKSRNCALKYKFGWWYMLCDAEIDAICFTCSSCWKRRYCLKATVMKLKRRI